MCIYIGVKKLGHLNAKKKIEKSGYSYTFFLKKGFIIYLAVLKRGL